MARSSSSTSQPPPGRRQITPLRLLLLAILFAAAVLIKQFGAPQPPAEKKTPADVAEQREAHPEPVETPEAGPSTIDNVTIRDSDGQIVFRGTVDVQPTLDRIAAGKLLDYRNDGSTFANREGRLPKQRAGYYKEYVHPTRGLSGPGPQRIVTGAEGEVYYTPDHYRTFKKLR